MPKFEEVRIRTLMQFPDFRLIEKSSSRFMKVLDFCLKLITLWQMDQFMVSFVTTIGYKVYTPANWRIWDETTRCVLLRHERVHMHQKKKYKWLFGWLYLFLPVPTVFAYYRKKFEMEAYEETIRARKEYGANLYRPAFRAAIVRHFTTAEYFWMYPFKAKVEKWYDDFVEKLHSTPGLVRSSSEESS
jgi:hypothetical protein